MSLVIERMRRRDSSDSRIMPSMPLYSSSDTYAPISAMDLTCFGGGGGVCGEESVCVLRLHTASRKAARTHTHSAAQHSARRLAGLLLHTN